LYAENQKYNNRLRQKAGVAGISFEEVKGDVVLLTHGGENSCLLSTTC
jgi:hypothetical protein